MPAMPPALVKTLNTRHGPMLGLPGDRYVTRALEVYGEFSPDEGRLLAQVVRPGMIVVEVGANIGAHTVAMARACRPGVLMAFEPQRRIFQILCANLVLNDIDNVIARPEACGMEAGEATVPPLNYAGADNFGGVSLLGADQAGERVRVVRIDDLGLTALGLLKVDVEGQEIDVLGGAAETIARTRPVLYVENDRPASQRALVTLIHHLGYQMYWHTPALCEVENFNGVKDLVFERNILSLNMLCLPIERGTQVNAELIDPADPRLPASLDPDRGPVGG
jgi:FkbM family methyltransferase